MDYEDEQSMEMEALESILGEEGLRKYTGPTPSGWSSERSIHAIKVSPETEEGKDCSCDLLFQHTATYPEELPMLKLSNTRGLTNKEVDKLTALLIETAEEHLGMASVFAIMQAAQEWMESKAGLQQEEDPEVVKKREAAEEERRLLEARAHGTPVTPESFAAWKAVFEEEMRLARVAAGEVQETEVVAGRKTGKQFFIEKYESAPGGPNDGELDVDELDEEDLGEFDPAEEDLEGLEDDDDDEFLDQYLAENEEDSDA